MPLLAATVPGAHGVGVVEPVAHDEPAGHEVQLSALGSLGLSPYVPASHAAQRDFDPQSSGLAAEPTELESRRRARSGDELPSTQ